MDKTSLITEKVRHYYFNEDINCATTSLLVLAEIFGVQLEEQLVDAAVGLHGGGKYGAQCGLVEGPLMFIGILGKAKGLDKEKTVELCYQYAQGFEAEFGSLVCRVLRPQGFDPQNPPHLCLELTINAILFAYSFICRNM